MRSVAICLGVYLSIAIAVLLGLFLSWPLGGSFADFLFVATFFAMLTIFPAAICASLLMFPLLQSGFIESLPRRIVVFQFVAFSFSAMLFMLFRPMFEGP